MGTSLIHSQSSCTGGEGSDDDREVMRKGDENRKNVNG